MKHQHFFRGLLCGLFLLGMAHQPVTAQQPEGNRPSVQVVPVTAQDVTRSSQFVGRVEAIQQVEIHPRVEGFIQSVQFTEGSMVKRGRPLFTIDPSTYAAALETAQAAVQVAEAQLAAAQASATNASLHYDRVARLRASGTSSQAQLDDATAQRDAAAAQVQQAQAGIAQAKAQEQSAQINLDFTKITSPIDGQIGKANETVGNLVSPGSGTLATVVQTNPIRVAFSVSDTDYLKVAEMITKGDATASSFVPHIKLPDGSIYEHPGKVAFANNTVDQSTGTIVIRADFENPDLYLIPGQFVNVTVQQGDPQSLPVVPGAAVLQDREGTYVFVLGDEDRVEERRITTAQRTGDGWAVSEGLQVGEMIIVGGLQRVSAGMQVTPVNTKSGG